MQIETGWHAYLLEQLKLKNTSAEKDAEKLDLS